jgi:hypothetical protein
MMIDRIMPKPDIYATCPNEGKILAFYSGTFDAVFVSLSPFIEPVSIAPSLFCPETYPSRSVVIAGCKGVSWCKVMSLTGLPTISAIDIGLKTRIHGLKEEFCSQEYAKAIDAIIDSTGILPPPEGVHSDLLHNKVLELFQELGHECVWIGDEFCSERKLHWVDDLKNKPDTIVRGPCNIFSPDKSMLWTVHWDSHFSFLCSSHENLEHINISDRLEGFFCSPQTDVYWSVRGES